MGRIFIDGFEHGHYGLWEAGGAGTVAITTANAIDGDYSVSITGRARISKSLGTTYNEIYLAGKFNFQGAASIAVRHIFDLDKNTSRISSVRLSSNEVIHLYRQHVSISSATAALSTNVNYRIEFHSKISSANGIGKVLVNGETVIDFTSNTKAGVDDVDFNILRIGATYYINPIRLVDDIVIDTTVFPGKTKIMALVPDSSGGSTGWTPSTGENYACINEIPPTTVEGVSINTTGAVDLYNISALDSIAGEIKCIQISALAETEGAPDAQNLEIGIAHNNTAMFSAGLIPGTAGDPKYVTKLWENNPITASAFTPSEISSLQIGIKATLTA